MKEELELVEVDFEELEIVDLGKATKETRQPPGSSFNDSQWTLAFHPLD